MKKFILVLLSVFLCLSLFSCEGDVVISSSSEVTSSEIASSVEDTSSEEIVFEEKIEVSESISQEDKEKALMYIDTLGIFVYDLGWDEINKLPPSELISWYAYRIYNKGTLNNYLDENNAKYNFPKEELENEALKYFNGTEITWYFNNQETYSAFVSEDFSRLPKKSLKLNRVEKIDDLFKVYFTITQNGLDVSRDMLLTVRESDDSFKFVSYVANAPEFDENFLKDTIRHEFSLSGIDGSGTKININLPRKWSKNGNLKFISPDGFSISFIGAHKFGGKLYYSDVFKSKDEYHAEYRNTIESGLYNYPGQIGKWYYTYGQFKIDGDKEHIIDYYVYTGFKGISVHIYVDNVANVNKAISEFEKYLPTLEIG